MRNSRVMSQSGLGMTRVSALLVRTGQSKDAVMVSQSACVGSRLDGSRSIKPGISQSISQSIDQSINQSINQSI